MNQWDLNVVSDEEYLLGENPLWHPEKKELWWTDVVNKTLFSYNPVTKSREVKAQGKSVSSFAFMNNGDLICGCLEGLYVWNNKKGFQLIADYHNDDFLQINDGIADVNGRFLFGTNYYDADNRNYKKGKLYLLDINGDIFVLDNDIQLSNGLAFSADNKTLYYTDSVARTIYNYPYNPETGKPGRKGIFVKVPETEGIPDGMTVDSEDFIWSAQWYGACIVRYTPSGKVDRRIELPVKQVSSLAFGGDELSDIYITTAASSWISPAAPVGYDFNVRNIGGKIYIYQSGIKGKPEYYAHINTHKGTGG